jgi:adenylate cyclase
MLSKYFIIKHRYNLKIDNFTWEVDEFHHRNFGLWLAEIELKSENQKFNKPSWLGQEVTLDPRFKNKNLARNPWNKDWIL